MAERKDLISALEARSDYNYLMEERRKIPAFRGSESTEKLIIHYLGDADKTNTPLEVEVM